MAAVASVEVVIKNAKAGDRITDENGYDVRRSPLAALVRAAGAACRRRADEEFGPRRPNPSPISSFPESTGTVTYVQQLPPDRPTICLDD
jgi:hypothetical protein